MKYLVSILLFLSLSLSGRAQSSVTATIALTSAPTNGQTLTIAGTVFRWTNSPITLAQIATTNTAAKSATNLYTKLASAVTNRYLVRYGSATSVTLQSYLGQIVSVSASAGWATVTFATNTAGGLTLGADYLRLNGVTIHDWTDIGTGTATNAIGTVKTNGVAVGASLANLDIIAGANTTVTGALSGATAKVAVNVDFASGREYNGTFVGSGARLTNFYAATNFNITISARGIANGLSPVANDGKDYGPDTPGTTTCGIQEAYNAAVAGKTIFGPDSVSVSLQFGSGYYYFTNALVFSNRFNTALSLRGQDQVSSKLVYAGSNAGISTITIRGPHTNVTGWINGLTMPMSVLIRDIGFAAINDATNILLTVTNYSHADIVNCNFTSWMVMTNQDWGSGMSIVGQDYYPVGSSLVGLVIGHGGENGTMIQRCNFGGLGNGVHLFTDHIYMRDTTFSAVGETGTGATTSQKWQTSSLYSLGAAIIRQPGLNSIYSGVYFYGTHNALVFNNSQSSSISGDYQVMDNCWFEGAGLGYELTAYNTNGVRFYVNGGNHLSTYRGRLTNSAGVYSIVSGTPSVRRAMYENNRDNAEDEYTLIYASKYEAKSGGGFYGDGIGLTNITSYALKTNPVFDVVAAPSRMQIKSAIGGLSASFYQFYTNGVLTYGLVDDSDTYSRTMTVGGNPTLSVDGSIGGTTITASGIITGNGSGLTNLSDRVLVSGTPASAGASGLPGQVRYDSSYLYICTATNTWRRISHATW
jgi:hypothetical protein